MLTNNFYEDTEESPGGIAFRDLITGALGLLFIIIILLDVSKEITKAEQVFEFIPGSITTIISWPPELNTDIDLWVWNSKEENAIGYSNRGGVTIDLMRDDLGFVNDTSGLNMEMNSSRGIIEGKWVINIHYYSGESDSFPGQRVSTPSENAKKIVVSVVVTMYNKETKSSTDIVRKKVILTKFKEEVTVISFEIDDKGKVIVGSKNNIHKPLRQGEVSEFGR